MSRALAVANEIPDPDDKTWILRRIAYELAKADVDRAIEVTDKIPGFSPES